MNKEELVEGKFYAYRVNPRNLSIPWRKVEYLGVVNAGQARIKWVDGDEEGSTEWVRTSQLLCRWGHRQREQRDGERKALLREHYRKHKDTVLEDAIMTVMEASGDPCATGIGWEWCEPPAGMKRVWERAGLSSLEREPLSFTDRHGMLHLSFASALKWSKAFAAREPETVAMFIDREVEKQKAQGFGWGDSFSHELLRQYRPAYAVARGWAQEADRDYLKERITKLQTLLSQAVSALEKVGEDREAKRLRRAAQGL